MQSMKGATKILSGMNRSMNLPQLSKIAMDFERENDIMDQRQEMMEDAVDDAVGFEEEDVESDDIINKVLDEIGVDLNQMVRCAFLFFFFLFLHHTQNKQPKKRPHHDLLYLPTI